MRNELTDIELKYFVERGFPNDCYIDGLLEDGRKGRSAGWLSDAQVANPSLINPGIFTKITGVVVLRRWTPRSEMSPTDPGTYDPARNLIEAARKVAAELASDDPKVVGRLMKRRHILAAVLNVPAKNLAAFRGNQSKQEAA